MSEEGHERLLLMSVGKLYPKFPAEMEGSCQSAQYKIILAACLSPFVILEQNTTDRVI